MREEKLIQAIRNGGEQESQALEWLYRHHAKAVVSMVKKRGGSKEEGHDIFQEAIIVFYERVKRGTYQPSSPISAFLHVVSRNLWIKEWKKSGHSEKVALEESETHEVNAVDRLLDAERSEALKAVLDQLKKDCREILRHSIYLNLSMDDIAARFGFQNAQVARNKKSRCLSYLRELIRKSPHFSAVLRKL